MPQPPAALLPVAAATVLIAALAPIPARAQAVELPEIVVTAPSPVFARPATAAALGGSGFPVGVLPVATDVFAPVTVVPRDRLEREGARNLGEALFDKPGLSSSSYAPGAGRPIVRGLDNFRVRIQENGVGVKDVSELGEDHAVPLNPLVNDRIEVVRGPATLRYGSTAIGGVVSAENQRIPTFVPVEGITGRVLGAGTTADRGREGAFTVDAGKDGVAFHADAFRQASDSYNTPRGRERNSASESQGGAVGISRVFDRGFVGLSFSHFDSDYQVPGGEAAASRTRLDPRQDKVAAKGEVRPEGGPFEVLRFWAGAADYKHDERGTGADGLSSVRATFKNREYEARIEAQHVPIVTGIGTLTGAVGTQFGRRKLGTAGEAGSLLRPNETRAVAGYLFEELAVTERLRFQAAGRVERVTIEGIAPLFPRGLLPTFTTTVTPGEDTVDADGNVVPGDPVTTAAPDPLRERARRREFAPKSASFGALYKLDHGVVASLTGSYVERAPASPELFSRGPHDATGTFEIGDPALKLERARTVEAGLRRAQGPLRFDLSVYSTRYTGFIYKRETGAFCDGEFETCGSGSELKQVAYTQRNATFTGGEAAMQADLIPIGTGFLGLDAQADVVRARFDDGTRVPRIPQARLGGGLFYRDTDAGFFARIGVLHAFDRSRPAPEETPTKGYDLLRAELSYTRKLDRLVHGLSEVTLGFRADNLLNDEVRNSASFKKDEVLLPGRTARLFVSARF